jgi:tetratricopeptide (TPR) repeat protein
MFANLHRTPDSLVREMLRNKAYSVVEILFVVAIIATLVSTVFLISMHRSRDLQNKIREAEAKKNQSESNTSISPITFDEDLKIFRQKLELYRYGSPSDQQEMPLVYRVGLGVPYEGANIMDNEKFARNLLFKAVMRMRSGNLEEARHFLKEAVILNPFDPDIFVELARVSFLQDDIPAALEEIKESMRHEPEYADPWLLRARILLKQGNFAGAEADLKKAAEMKQKNAEIFLIWSEFYLKKGDPQMAEDFMQRFRQTEK